MSDYSQMSDEQLNQMEAQGIEDATPAEMAAEATPEPQQAAETPGDTEAPAPGSADQDTPQQQEPATPPEGEQPQQPRTVPLAEHIELRKRAQAAEERARQFEQQQAQAQAEADERAIQARYEELLLDDPEQAAEFARQVEQQRTQHAQAEYQQRLVADRIALSVDFARKNYQDYDAQIDKLYERFGQAAVVQMAAQQDNPAEWAYNLAREFQTPAERAASIQAEVQKQVAEALSKQTDPPSRGQKSVGHLTATNPSGAPKDPAQMTEAELEEAERESRANW